MQVDHGIRNRVFKTLPVTAGGAVLKGRQMATMPEEGSSLTAGISKVPRYFELGIITSSDLQLRTGRYDSETG